jgi:hypothetical protein
MAAGRKLELRRVINSLRLKIPARNRSFISGLGRTDWSFKYAMRSKETLSSRSSIGWHATLISHLA